MSKMFDYISGKAQGREAELEATLEHLMAHCVPESEYELLRIENRGLRAALEEIVRLDSPPLGRYGIIANTALNEETK